MSYEVRWEVPNRIIYQRFHDVVTVQDVQNAQAKVIALIAESDGVVHTIVDLLEVVRYPRNLMEIREILNRRTRNDAGWVLLVNRNPLLGFMSSVVTRLAIQNSRFRVFATLQEAFDFLAEQDKQDQHADQAKQEESVNPDVENAS